MSSVIDPTQPFISTENITGGFTVFGFRGQENRLNGSDGKDIIFGGDKGDELFGGAGEDIISGGAGRDVLTGGAGKDTFAFFFDADTSSADIDRSTDFNPNQDKIRLQGVSSDSLIEYNSRTGILTVGGVEIAQLSPGLKLNEQSFEFVNHDREGNDVIESGASNFVIDGGIDRQDDKGKGDRKFVFSLDDDLSLEDVKHIPDFDPQTDPLHFQGISADANVDYNSETGMLSIDGKDIVRLDAELDIDEDDYELL